MGGTASRQAVVKSARAGGHVSRPVSPRNETTPDPQSSGVPMRAISGELARIEVHLDRVEDRLRPLLDHVHPEWLESARNLVRYVALRQLDLRELQLLLQQHGLSSLGRSESFVMRSLLEVRTRVAETLLARGEATATELEEIVSRRHKAFSWQMAKFLLHGHTHAVFGPKPNGRHVYVMVTAPGAEEADAAWLGRMLLAGMNVLRINCAHEGVAEWSRILAALACARRDTGLGCRVLMDLAGPKIRTGRMADGVRVATWKIRRDVLGRIVEPARVVLRAVSRPGMPTDSPVLLLDDDWFAELRRGDVLRFRDSRRKKRRFVVRIVGGDEAIAETRKRAYVVDKTSFLHQRGRRVLRRGQRVRISGTSSAFIPLATGDRLVLTRRDVAGRAARRDAVGRMVGSALVACTLPDALSRVEVGHRVLFDDGKIEAIVERVTKADLHLRVRRTSGAEVKLRPEKGINLPDSPLPVSALTPEDRADLAFVARHADLVGLSFVRAPDDVEALQALLGEREIGVVLKIETKMGFENLPRILLAAMRRPPVAIMIARGDLAVEVGFERLAEVQEEILWLCEASHVPAIWATQVLDSLARSGVPSRAEVTDAAASVAAECVMLNKGPHVEDAVRALVDILRRMEQHHYKKRSIFRKLHVSSFGPDVRDEKSAADVE